MVLGLTGKNAAGKGEVARMLERRSFIVHSLSDEIRRDLESTKTEITRETLIERGRELRRRWGPGILAERILARCDQTSNHVVDSIRHPAEAAALRQRADFVLLGITGKPETRYARLAGRARPGDPRSFEEFERLEKLEEGNPEGSAAELERTLELAAHTIANEGTLEELEEKVLELVRGLLTRADRPSWDQYFMDIAMVVASRSNCLKRKVAAVIVKDRRIVSTGYNGTPRGTKNCNEGGCPRCYDLAPGGSRLGECLCSHGEENAIVQAAYHGVSLKGATLYSTCSPCLICAKMIINAGVNEVVYRQDYPLNERAAELLAESGVEVRQLSGLTGPPRRADR